MDGHGLTEGADTVLVAAVGGGFLSPMAHDAVYKASDGIGLLNPRALFEGFFHLLLPLTQDF